MAITVLPRPIVGSDAQTSDIQGGGVQPAVVRADSVTPAGVELPPRVTLAQANPTELGGLQTPQVTRLTPQQPGLSLNTQNDLRAAYERLGADPATRDALVARLATLPWGDALDFDRNDSAAVLRALPRIHDILKAGFDVTSGDAPIALREVATAGQANCFGSTQVYLGMADALGLAARPIQVTDTTSGKPTLHVASMVDLPDGRQVTVDMLYADAVSQPFRLSDTYHQDGTVLRVNDSGRGHHYDGIRLLDRNQLRTFVDSQSPPPFSGEEMSPAAYEHILRYTDAAIAADPNNPWLYRTRAENLEHMRPDRWGDTLPPAGAANLRRQAEDYRRAMELSPNTPDFPISLGRVYQNLGDHAAALGARQRGLEVFERRFLPQLREAAGLPANTSLDTVFRSPAAESDDYRSQIEAWVAYRIDVGVSMGRSGDTAGARAYLEETRRLMDGASGARWFEYYSGQSYIDEFSR